MAGQLLAVCFDALRPQDQGRFWAELLGWEAVDDPTGEVTLLPRDDTGFRIRFVPTREPKAGQNRMHFDLTSTSLEDQRQTVERALALGGRRIDVGQGPDAAHVVLADPEGNELCVIQPGNRFLAGCGFVGALACDGTQEVGYFWSAALGWPLVWDQDQETAIRSPHGGPKLTWGGPPLMPRTGRDRVRFDVAPPVGGGLLAEVDRLAALGAARLGTGRADATAMTDPDGNEFRLLAP
ncbi:VOC family protein [Catellatospora sp. KI3]|nr:VOC family protein [Catellatospora sp. KI3]MDI1465179.1 VOC family protein [Catellatospora sp. KI3]